MTKFGILHCTGFMYIKAARQRVITLIKTLVSKQKLELWYPVIKVEEHRVPLFPEYVFLQKPSVKLENKLKDIVFKDLRFLRNNRNRFCFLSKTAQMFISGIVKRDYSKEHIGQFGRLIGGVFKGFLGHKVDEFNDEVILNVFTFSDEVRIREKKGNIVFLK